MMAFLLSSAVLAFGPVSHRGRDLLAGWQLSTLVWALCGAALRSVLIARLLVRAFNVLMAILLLASLYPVFMDA
jgi:hypothetical protein